ncbi:MAG: DUF692 domain-containing protein [Acidobacteriota bacterium]|nr:DUF692 domain-containing protein [Acidobacteriota bacterium]
MTARSLAAIPHLGSGMGYRRQMDQQIHDHADRIDFLEVVTEQFIFTSRVYDELAQLSSAFTVIPHGVGVSIGSATPPPAEYLARLKQICAITKPPYYSEHLCMTRAPGITLGHLAPLLFNEESLAHVIRNVDMVQQATGLPLILENITFYFEIPGSTLSQTEFFRRVTQATGCGVLVDVANLYINSRNHRFDAVAFLEDLPLDHVIQVHLAGGVETAERLVDTHSHSVQDEIWALLDELLARTEVKGIIVERDSNYDGFDTILAEVIRARGMQNAALEARAGAP